MQENYNNFISLITMSKLYFAFIIFCCSLSINAQHNPKFKLSLSLGMSHTGSLIYGDRYQEWEGGSTFIVKNTNSARLPNYNLGVGYQLSKSFSINGSIGVASYGFSYKADVIAPISSGTSSSSVYVSDNFTLTLMEVGFSGAYQFKLSNDIQFIIQPGLVWYTNPRFIRSQILRISQNSNNFSASLFTGIELPISNNQFYVSIGLNTKIPLGDFANIYSIESVIYPYAIGLQTTILYRFGSISKDNRGKA